MTATCKDCQAASLNLHWGGYRMACIECCARLVRSCSPDKTQGEAMLASMGMRPGRPTRAEVLAYMREQKAASSSQVPGNGQEPLL